MATWSRKHTLAAVVASLVVFSVVCVSVWRSVAQDERPPNPRQGAAAPAELVPLEDQERIVAALRGETGVEGGLVDGLSPVDAELPAGSGIDLQVQDATVDGDLARVPATVTGPLAGRWTVLLVRVEGRWRAYGTVQS